MSAPEHNYSAPIDPVKLDRLAEVAIKVGLHSSRAGSSGDRANGGAAAGAQIAEHAYKAGAGL